MPILASCTPNAGLILIAVVLPILLYLAGTAMLLLGLRWAFRRYAKRRIARRKIA